MLPRFYELTILSDECYECPEDHQVPNRDLYQNLDHPVKNVVVAPTQPFDQELKISRSLKMKPSDFQISFQDTILEEHESALEKEVENFIEATFLNGTTADANNFSFWKQRDPFSEDEFSLQDNPYLSTGEKNQYKKDLENEPKLNDFLKLISTRVCESAAHELTYISYMVWEEYVAEKKNSFGSFDYSALAAKFTAQRANSLFEESRIKFLNLSEVSVDCLKPIEELKKAFENFIKFWSTTVLLVIEEYFQNPYSGQATSLKRERNFELENEFSSQFQSDGVSFLGAPCKKWHNFDD